MYAAEDTLIIQNLLLKGKQLLKALVRHAENDRPDSKRSNRHQAADARRAARIEHSILKNRIGKLIGAFVVKIKLRVPEDSLFIVGGILCLCDDLAVADQHGAERIIALFPGARREFIASFDIPFMQFIHMIAFRSDILSLLQIQIDRSHLL